MMEIVAPSIESEARKVRVLPIYIELKVALDSERLSTSATLTPLFLAQQAQAS
jgi:hypothetical protein